MQNPKTITIYLAEGDPRGIRIAEIAQWTGKAVVIPRSKLREAKARPEITQASVYFLFGEDPNASLLPRVYIGKAEILGKRVKPGKIHQNMSGDWDLFKYDIIKPEFSRILELIEDHTIRSFASVLKNNKDYPSLNIGNFKLVNSNWKKL